MSFPRREGWEIPECLLVGKTVWDAFQDFPKRKALFFFADVVGSEWRADCRGCASHVCPRPWYLWSSQETNKLLNLALPASISLLLRSLFVKTLILRKLIVLEKVHILMLMQRLMVQNVDWAQLRWKNCDSTKSQRSWAAYVALGWIFLYFTSPTNETGLLYIQTMVQTSE